MDQWKAKREAVFGVTTCVQTQTADINPSTDETTQTDQHNSDVQAINIPTVLTLTPLQMKQRKQTSTTATLKPSTLQQY